MAALDNVNAAIAQVIQPYIEDVTFTDIALMAVLESTGRVMQQDPSLDITWPITKDKLNTGTYRGFFKFPGQEKQVFDKATVDWKQAYCDFAISAYDALRARGPYAAYQLSDGLKNNAKMSIAEFIGKQCYANGKTNAGLDFDGLEIGADNGDTYATYATIARSAIPGWKGYNDLVGKPVSFALHTEAQGNCTFGNSRPDLAITTQTLWNSLHGRAQAQQIFDAGNTGNQVANLGFDVLRNIGCSITHDAQCPSGRMYGITTDKMELIVMPDRVWSFTGYQQVPGADGYQAQFLFMGNFTFKAPRQLYKLGNLTA